MASRLRPRSKHRISRAPRAPIQTELSADWQRWVARDLLRGVDPRALVATLVRRDVPLALADRTVAAIAASPIFDVARAERARASRLELVERLRATLDVPFDGSPTVARRSGLSAAVFFEHHYRRNVPVVLPDIVPRWPALARWTPGSLRDRFASVEVSVMMDRDRDPLCDRNIDAHAQRTTFGAFAEQVMSAGETNDVYLVANNHALEAPALAALLDDIAPLPDILASPIMPGTACLWFGPKGTLTPLHHDANNILFCQIHGKKRVRMLPPHEAWLLADLEGFYSPVDLDAPDLDKYPALRDAAILDVTLHPGEALFLPVGWYHHVRALDPSISISFTGFSRPNHFSWYAPGNVR